MTTISRRPRAGTRHCSIYARKVGPFIAPSSTNGAIIPSWRKPATKVIVFQCPCGTDATSRSPRKQRPLSRTIFVLVAVSSINTSRAGSSMPCSRIQRRRARATSARCRSAACRLFFKRDVVAIEKAPKRAAAGSNPPFAQLCDNLYQSQILLFFNQGQDLAGKLFERRSAAAARLRRGAPCVAPALYPLYRRAHAYLETFGCLVARRSRLHRFDNAFPQVTRIGLRHRQPP